MDERILAPIIPGVFGQPLIPGVPAIPGSPLDAAKDVIEGRPFHRAPRFVKSAFKGLRRSTPDIPLPPPQLPPPEALPPTQANSEEVGEAVSTARRPRGFRRQTIFNVGGPRGLPGVSPIARSTFGA